MTTVGKLSQLIRDAYYRGQPNDDRNFDDRYWQEQVAICVAEMATTDAFQNSSQGETTYANDQFISEYKNVPIQKDTDGTKYSILPATPTSLPNNQEINSVRINGSNCMDVVPMKNHLAFAQSLISYSLPFITYKVQDGKLIYNSPTPTLAGTVNITMVGAVGGDNLGATPLNIPKNYEARIIDMVLARVNQLRGIPQDLKNDSVSNNP